MVTVCFEAEHRQKRFDPLNTLSDNPDFDTWFDPVKFVDE
jgi:hypothetical protein